MEIFPSSQKIKHMEKILNYYKNLIIINDEKVKELENSIILREFYKSAIMYKKVIDNYLKILQKLVIWPKNNNEKLRFFCSGVFIST